MAIAAFLPLYQLTGLLRLAQDNTIIQTSGGWILVAVAVGVAATSASA